MEDKYIDVNNLINSLFAENLRQLFDKRLFDLGINQTEAEKLLGVARRTLNGIIDGTQKRANFSSFNKLALFLNIKPEELIKMHLTQLEKSINNVPTPANKKNFIRENFDLAALKKAGFIDDISNYAAIENRITSFLGYNSIFEYRKRMFDVAFSASAITPKRQSSRELWLTVAKKIISKIDSPYYYHREELKRYFPQIRWHSTDIDSGLKTVIKTLYKLGVTVVFLPRLSSLHLRGATFAVDGQPCIVLTDYRGFYPTLWHCLIHELYHVLIDWEEIKRDSYHLSEDAEDSLSVDAKEAEADEFARRYLFNKEKLSEVRPYLNDSTYIYQVAKDNNIDPSIIYIYNAFDNGKLDRKAWMRARRYNPDIKRATSGIEIAWDKPSTIEDQVKRLKIEIYN